MVNLPWLEDPNYAQNYPQYTGGGGFIGGQGGGSDILSYLKSMQPTPRQSIASMLPFLNLPGQQSKYFQPAQAATANMGNAAAAMTDTDSPLYKKIYGQQRAQGQQNLAESIAELTGQNRKLASMGRVPLFNPERGGETLFRGINKGYQDVQNQAADQTQTILGNSANNYAREAALREQQAGTQAQLAANKSGIQGNLLGALAKLFSL